jgi:hypothetical protein
VGCVGSLANASDPGEGAVVGLVDGEDAWVASGAVGGFCDTAVKANGQVTWSAASCAIAATSVVEFDCAGADPSYRNRSELPHC